MALGRGLEALLMQNRETFVPDEEGVREIDPSQIQPSPFQPRKQFDEQALQDLENSIREHGILQPVVVRRSGRGFELIAGERRWRAAQKAGLKRIPARVMVLSDEKLLEIALIENIQREDLNPIEKAHGFKELGDRFQLTQEEIAKKVGLERSTVANVLRLLELAPEVQDRLGRSQITMGHARALLSLREPARQREVCERIVKEGLSVRNVEEIASGQAALAATGEPPSGPVARNGRKKPKGPKDAVVADYEERLRRALGAHVAIRARAGRGTIQIRFGNDAEFMRLLALLERNPRFTV